MTEKQQRVISRMLEWINAYKRHQVDLASFLHNLEFQLKVLQEEPVPAEFANELWQELLDMDVTVALDGPQWSQGVLIKHVPRIESLLNRPWQ